MAARQKLTKRLVDAAKAGPKDSFLWDSEVVGFGVKLNPKGRKTYVAQYRAAAARAGSPSALTARPGRWRRRGSGPGRFWAGRPAETIRKKPGLWIATP